jgi:crotonobetainyl-CoA:carnitine CoA-transferase CaiB-like acyl-CoA transferase
VPGRSADAAPGPAIANGALSGLHEEVFGGRPTGPLAGAVVLDFGQAAVGPIAASYLAMLGALVIKVERPTGDHVRHVQPAMQGTSHTFIGNNLGQLGITLDLRTAEGRRTALDLIASADVLIENFRGPEVMAQYGLDYASAAAVNPRLVYVQSTAFGAAGPLSGMRSNEWVTQALGGFAVATGSEELPEFSHNTSHLDWNGAMVNALAAIAGLLQRRRDGWGLLVQTSQLGSTLLAGAASWLPDGGPEPGGSAARRRQVAQIVRTAEGGWVAVAARTGRELDALTRMAASASTEQPDGDAPSSEELVERLRSFAARTATAELLAALHDARVPNWCFDPAERILDRLLREPVIRDGGVLEQLDTPWGSILSAAPHWRFSRTPAVVPGPPPRLGEHTSTVVGRLAARPARDDLPDAQVLDEVPLRPLAGTAVLVCGNHPAVSLCACVLECLGAEIRRAEPTDRQDDWRDELTSALAERVGRWPTATAQDSGADPVGGDTVPSGGARVFLLGPDVPEDVPARGAEPGPGRSDDVWCRVSDWGARLPDPPQAASELTVQTLTGMNRFVGTPQGTLPLGYPVITVNTALAAAQAVLAARLHAAVTGEGQYAEVSMTGVAVALSQWNVVGESGVPDAPVGRQLEAYGWSADHGFRLSDRWCLIDLRDNEAGWLQFFLAVGRPDLLADERFNDIGSLQRHRTLLPSVLAEQLAKVSLDDMDRFIRQELGGTIVPILSPVESATHPQSQGLGVVAAGPEGRPELGLPIVARAVSHSAGAAPDETAAAAAN